MFESNILLPVLNERLWVTIRVDLNVNAATHEGDLIDVLVAVAFICILLQYIVLCGDVYNTMRD